MGPDRACRRELRAIAPPHAHPVAAGAQGQGLRQDEAADVRGDDTYLAKVLVACNAIAVENASCLTGIVTAASLGNRFQMITRQVPLDSVEASGCYGNFVTVLHLWYPGSVAYPFEARATWWQ